jgi:hypothetical protein
VHISCEFHLDSPASIHPPAHTHTFSLSPYRQHPFATCYKDRTREATGTVIQ